MMEVGAAPLEFVQLDKRVQMDSMPTCRPSMPTPPVWPEMVAPPGWTEPYQTPEFDEVTIVIRGRMQVEHSGGKEVAGPVPDGRSLVRPD